jgi:hypothetical protein
VFFLGDKAPENKYQIKSGRGSIILVIIIIHGPFSRPTTINSYDSITLITRFLSVLFRLLPEGLKGAIFPHPRRAAPLPHSRSIVPLNFSVISPLAKMAAAPCAIIANVCIGSTMHVAKRGWKMHRGGGWTCDISTGRCFAYVQREHSIVPIWMAHGPDCSVPTSDANSGKKVASPERRRTRLSRRPDSDTCAFSRNSRFSQCNPRDRFRPRR